jgi:hypothetical protein
MYPPMRYLGLEETLSGMVNAIKELAPKAEITTALFFASKTNKIIKTVEDAKRHCKT